MMIDAVHSKRGKRNRDGSHQKGAGTLPDVSRKFPCHFWNFRPTSKFQFATKSYTLPAHFWRLSAKNIIYLQTFYGTDFCLESLTKSICPLFEQVYPFSKWFWRNRYYFLFPSFYFIFSKFCWWRIIIIIFTSIFQHNIIIIYIIYIMHIVYNNILAI